MKLKLFLSAVIASAVFAACSSGGEDEPETTTPTNPTPEARIPLTVEVTEQPLINADPSRQADTRTDIATLSTLRHFKMSLSKRYVDEFVNDTYDFIKTGTKWNVGENEKEYWPSNSELYPFCFYAYTYSEGNITFNGGESPYISVKVEEGAFNQQDVLVAKSINYSAPKQSAVALTFDHICAAVGFTIRMTDNLHKALNGTKLYIKKVQLNAVAKTGDYHYDTGWTNQSSANAYYTITYSTHREVTTERTNMTDDTSERNPFYLFLIPQKTTPELKITYQIGDTEKEPAPTTTITYKEPVTWKKGYLYYIDINLGTANITL